MNGSLYPFIFNLYNIYGYEQNWCYKEFLLFSFRIQKIVYWSFKKIPKNGLSLKNIKEVNFDY